MLYTTATFTGVNRVANKKTDWPTRIKALREAHGWSQEIFANLIGLKTRGAVSLFESGERVPTGPVKRVIEALEKNPKIISKSC